jgi:hypothetical protein
MFRTFWPNIYNPNPPVFLAPEPLAPEAPTDQDHKDPYTLLLEPFNDFPKLPFHVKRSYTTKQESLPHFIGYRFWRATFLWQGADFPVK